ncbi:MAG: hypothetical protein V2J02_10605 [Pseudomonadales bacterium]|jgi:hypothetical protein|nr:hypothetical protein [Pseudomonadales bacterium]
MSLLRKFGVCCLVGLLGHAPANAEWHYGLGTGIYALNIEGDAAFGTAASGTVDIENDLDSSELSDMLDSARGLGGYATNGIWTIQASYGLVELENTFAGDGASLGGGALVAGSWERTQGEVAVSYNLFREGRTTFGVIGGVRMTEHDFDLATLNVQPGAARNVDEDWTDVILGVTHSYRLADGWTWASRAHYGSGGSEGTPFANTGLRWQAVNWLATTFYLQYEGVDFEEGNRGDVDYYAYDNDEFGAGIVLQLTW